MTDSKSLFTSIAEELAIEDIPAEIIGSTEESPVEQLLALLHLDEQQRRYLLQMTLVNEAAGALGFPMDDDEVFMTQMLVLLPIDVPETFAIETSLLLLTFNRILPYGAFGFSEEEGIVYLRYVSTSATIDPAPEVIVQNVLSLQYFVIGLTPHIEAVASGARGRAEVIEMLEAEGIMLPPLLA